jgi:hypothetical protein
MTDPRIRHGRHHGYGLADALLATLLLGLIAVGVAQLHAALVGVSAQAALTLRADAIANAYLAAMALEPPAATPCPGEAHGPGLGSLACYDGLDEAPHDHAREALAEHAAFRVAVSLQPGPLPGSTAIALRVSHPASGLVITRAALHPGAP